MVAKIGINGFGSTYINQINHNWFKNLSFLTVRGNFSVTASKPRIVLILTGFENRESYQSVEEICKSCEKNNIQTRNYFAGNILLHGAYKHLGNWEDYPEANKVLERVLFIGCSPNYTMDTLHYIDKTLQSWKH